ncbi:glycoside hydrolase family 26 protein [Thiocystis violacea]|uniref:glycoside hydrolase family 26 protein n=1 Tax=Thiocystis violacea TaxID=13725 RepID=UPI001908091D|nr:glycosyl hydrolase [Thiocystis violacea]
MKIRSGIFGPALTLLLLQTSVTPAETGVVPLGSTRPVQPITLAVPETGAYTGAYVDFGEHEDAVTLEQIESFSALVGKRQAIIAFSNYWGRGRFPTDQVRIIAQAGAVPLVFWNPWEDQEDTRKSRFDLAAIEAGQWDQYMDAWAAEARAFGRPLLVSWGLEMNGEWFPWSGVFHGAGASVPGADPPRYQGPEAFKRAYRYVVDRMRAAGATNLVWIFHPNNSSNPDAPWNQMAAYYPGSDYVDWLAMSAYGKQFPGENWLSVKESILNDYAELAALDPRKPILLAEWGVGEFPKQGDKGAWIRDALTVMEHQLPRLKAAVFWHEQWQNGDLSYSNLRVNSSLSALNAYREGVSHSFWLPEPRYSPAVPAPK